MAQLLILTSQVNSDVLPALELLSHRLRGDDADPVAQQLERGENVAVHLRGQDQQLRHASSRVSRAVYKRAPAVPSPSMGLMSRTLATALPVWLAVVAGLIVLVVLGAREVWLPSVPVIGAGALLLTFLVQVSLQSKDGLVRRMQVSVTGVVVILAVASLTMLLTVSGA